MPLDELEFGIKITRSFCTAIESQIGEAITISREQRTGTTLLNSKAEYNRYVIHRLDNRSEKEKQKETTELNLNENLFKELLKGIKKPQRTRLKENLHRS